MKDQMLPESGNVRVLGKLICASLQDIETVKQYLPEHIRLTKAEQGCLTFEVTQTDNPLVWRVEECFVNQQAFEQHQQRTRASVWWEATSTIKRAYEIFS